KPRGRKKKKIEEESPQPQVEADAEEIKPPVETLPEEIEQVLVQNEAKPGLFARISSLFRPKAKQVEPEPAVEVEETAPDPVEEKDVVPSLPADVILAGIGAQLRERRELISLTIDEVERHIKLRAVFVKALEDGAFDKLPSPVQTRGMLTNYATFLDLDVDMILLRFADA